MGETVDALGYKADVPARTKDMVSEKVDGLKSRIAGAGSQVSEAAPDGGEVKEGAQRAVGFVQENPLGLAVGAAAAGFLAGMLIPSTRVENDRIGSLSDQVKEQARQTGQEALEHGSQIAQETAQTATKAAADVKEAAQESAHSHAQDLTESAKESADQVRPGVSSEGKEESTPRRSPGLTPDG